MVNTDFHRIKYGFPHYCVYLCHVRVNLCLIILRQSRWYPTWKVERWGRSPSAFSRGLSDSATPGKPPSPKEKRRTQKQPPRKPIFAFFASWWEPRYRGFRFAPPPATSHSLRSGILPFRSCRWRFLPQISTELCTDFHKIMCCGMVK